MGTNLHSLGSLHKQTKRPRYGWSLDQNDRHLLILMIRGKYVAKRHLSAFSTQPIYLEQDRSCTLVLDSANAGICIVPVLWLRPNQTSINKPQTLAGHRPREQAHNGRTGACSKLFCNQVPDVPLQIEKAFQKQHLFQNAKVRGAADDCLLSVDTHLLKAGRRSQQRTSDGIRMSV